MTDNGAPTREREPGPLTWEPTQMFVGIGLEMACHELEDPIRNDFTYGDFPWGPNMAYEVEQGYGLNLLMEADMRAQAWTLLTEQAVVHGVALGRFTYAEVGQALGISKAAAHKRYARFVNDA